MANKSFLAGMGQDDSGKDTGKGGGNPAFQAGMQAGEAGMRGHKSKSTLKKVQAPTGLETEMPDVTSTIPSARKGGRVLKGGLVRVHRGENIVPASHHRGKALHRKVTKIIGSPVRKK